MSWTIDGGTVAMERPEARPSRGPKLTINEPQAASSVSVDHSTYTEYLTVKLPRVRHLTEEQMAQMDCPFGTEPEWPE